jgi:ABC-type antimicrobial peptide transport system permease subunit
VANAADHRDRGELSRRRFVAIVFVAFAATASALAAVGLAALIAWQVAQRTREIGIRMALGATSMQVVRAMMLDGAVIVGGGVTVGLAAAAGATTWLRSILYEVSPHDASTLASAAGLAAAVGLLSIYLPARRASAVDPLVALRQE